MSELGGRIALNGFLYQILSNLQRIAHFQLQDAKYDGQNIQSARLILEPREGGDAQYDYGNVRVVEQYKTRANNYTWSVNDLIEEVLPDLYKAVSPNCFSRLNKYRFVTDGRLGNIKRFYKFLDNFRSKVIPDDPSLSLDSEVKKKYLNNKNLTDREFFLHISSVLKGNNDTTDAETHQHKLWHLLSFFEIDDEKYEDELVDSINEFLIQVVNYREQLDGKRHELCSIIMERSINGKECTPEEILKEAGLDVIPLSKLGSCKSTLKSLLKNRSSFRAYFPDRDVRLVPEWPSEYPILILAGESGQGKTWQLFQTAYNILQKGCLSTVVFSQDDIDKVLQNASDDIWLESLRHDAPLTIQRLASRYKSELKASREYWLTICVDDIQDISQVRKLIDNSWKDWGIRLALTAPLNVGKEIHASRPNEVHLIEVKDFDITEVKDFLERQGYEWGDIPEDIRETLKRPILAELYCQISKETGWIPHNEYELYKSYWNRINSARGQLHHPSDRNALLKLVGTILKEDSRYPWNTEQRIESGVTDDVLQRLESIGWLRRSTGDEVEIWHDRLLNWAIAEWLIEQRRTDQIDLIRLVELIHSMYNNERYFSGKRLSYVPMDYIWLACDPENRVQDDVVSILKELTSHPSYGGYPRSLYEYLLPTLGKRILPELVKYLKECNSKEESADLRWSLMVKAITKIGIKEPEVVKDVAVDLIQNMSIDIQLVGIEILKQYPDIRAIDKLWEVHQYFDNELKDSKKNAHWKHSLSFSALRACAKYKPKWLVDQIEKADLGSEQISQLEWILASLDIEEGRGLWARVKQILISKTPPDKARGLIQCISRFKDKDEIPYLVQRLDCTSGFVSPSAFSALCRLDLDEALTTIEKLDDREAWFSKGWWMPELLFNKPLETHNKLLSISRDHKSGYRYIEILYSGFENLIEPEILEFIIDGIRQDLDRYFRTEQREEPNWLYNPLEFISKVHKADLLNVIELQSGKEFEDLILKLALSRLEEFDENRRWNDHIFELTEKIIFKICGQSLTHLTNAELGHVNYWVRSRGLQNALKRPDKRTYELLHRIMRFERDQVHNEHPIEQGEAVNILAALGDYDGLLEGVRLWGQYLPRSILSYELKLNESQFDYLQVTLNEIIENEDGQIDNALIAVGMSKNSKFLQEIHQILEKIVPDSNSAWCAAITLMRLGDKSDKFVEFLSSMLMTGAKDNQILACKYLLRIGTPEALGELVKFIDEVGVSISCNDSRNYGVEFILFDCDVTRNKIEKLISNKIRSMDSHILSGDCLKILPELNIENTYGILLDAAFATERDHLYDRRVIGAIRGLWKIDPDLALYACDLALKRLPHVKQYLPELMVNLSPVNAIGILCQHATNEDQTSIRWTIARALRLIDDPTVLIGKLRKMMESTDTTLQRVAVEICGWQAPGFMENELRSTAQEETEEKLVRQAIRALRNQEKEKWIKELMSQFSQVSPHKRWSYLGSIIELGDPYLLDEPQDRLWLGQILDEAPPEFWEYAEDEIERKKKDVASLAEKEDKE